MRENKMSQRSQSRQELNKVGQPPETAVILTGTKRVLVIDGADTDRTAMEEILKQAGYEVVLASDGFEGIDCYVNCYDSQCFDLVITDMVMPEKEGAHVILELLEKCAEQKIIAMSSDGHFPPELSLSSAKAVGVRTISKPLDSDEVINTVKELIG